MVPATSSLRRSPCRQPRVRTIAPNVASRPRAFVYNFKGCDACVRSARYVSHLSYRAQRLLYVHLCEARGVAGAAASKERMTLDKTGI